jgi:serine/threonine-protein kinase
VTSAAQRLAAALAGRYTIERELGGGGMSRVFLARETALGREVVIKIIAGELAAGVSAERFAREIATAARLQQANIVPVLSAGDADGLAYFTMPYVRGESLRSRMATAQLSPPERVSVLRDVARALAYAHDEGVVHRDIKPENVLLSHGTAMVTDFGIAKAVTASRTQGGGDVTLTQAGGSIGTPAYMAPEQAVGEAVDGRTDLYAWGIMAYELLSGGHPFARHTTPTALVTAHLTETPPGLPVASGIPPGVAAIVMRCLEKDPARRPDSAAEVVAALDGATISGGDQPVPASSAMSRVFRARAIVAIVLLGVLALWQLRPDQPATADLAPADKSLAVLPFESVGGDTSNAYFAEGIADELTNALARLPGLRLAGRSSANRFKGRGASAQEVGSALNVGSVLEGTVRRAGGRVRITAQLTGASDGLLLWSESYDREASDVFALQDEITRAIVSALQVRLASGAGPASATAQATDAETYDKYLRGVYLYRRRGTGLLRAEQLFTEVIARDSTFARGHAMLATVLLTQPYYFPIRVGDLLPRARAAAERAVALDPHLSEARQALGIAHFHAFEWGAGEREARRAIDLDANSSEATYRLGFILLSIGREAEAVPVLERSRAQDPLYQLTATYLGYAYGLVGRYDAAIAEGRRAVELDSNNLPGLTLLMRTYRLAGRRDDALTLARLLVERTDDQRRLGVAANIFGVYGEPGEARAILARLETMPPGVARREASLVPAYLGLGDTTQALAALERAADRDGDLMLAMVPGDMIWNPVRSSPRFAAVLRRMNLDPALFASPRGRQ